MRVPIQYQPAPKACGSLLRIDPERKYKNCWRPGNRTFLYREKGEKVGASEFLRPKKRLNRRPTNGGW